ncbi:THAP domain-containing protein 1-like [Ooceraea biroi]|uniref:THAP domain-containing protein 1-like n=1 Tax=Ooceraea biroi TaxID=2015173 RepID=UPI000F07E755|nr:THAP domain-containing protein 1-like [Ooceraea biroi]
MPYCYVKNCTNRTVSEKIKFFQFPKEPSLLQQWLKACRKNKEETKTDSATVCSLHFNDDCFEMIWTKPRQKNVSARQIWRLKKGSIPTKVLNLEKKRKNTCHEGDNKRIKTT